MTRDSFSAITNSYRNLATGSDDFFVAGQCTHYFDDHAMACDVGSDGLDCWIFTETDFEQIDGVNSRHHEGKCLD